MNNLEIVKDLYYKKSNLTKGFKPIDTTYLFTTEDIKSYMPNLEGKKVLSVASSGDQYFNALLRGAKKVDLFDINPLPIGIIFTHYQKMMDTPFMIQNLFIPFII